MEMLAKGEVDIGLTFISEIITEPGVEVVGPLPRDISDGPNWSHSWRRTPRPCRCQGPGRYLSGAERRERSMPARHAARSLSAV
jgi:hypothetical protein